MIRLLLRVGVMIAANALGLIVAATALDDMTLAADGFFIAVGLFSAVHVLTQPALTLLGVSRMAALAGSSALLSTLVALIVADIVSDGLRIHGPSTWVLATVIVWVVAMVGGLLLPLLFLRRWFGPGDDQPTKQVYTWR